MNNDEKTSGDVPSAGDKPHLEFWDTENEKFWEREGKKIANTNLWISIPNLLLAFAVWIIFSIMVVKIQQIHDLNPTMYAFADMGSPTGDNYKALLFTLPAVAGLSGATLRVPNSFMIAISGGRVTKTMTSLLLLTPALLLGIFIQDPNVAFTTLVIIAVMVGVGGGAFASSMSNISFFFPKKMQGTALGLNAGLGNVGVSIMQLAAPLVMTFQLFGSLSGPAAQTEKGTIYIANGALIWVPLAAIFMLAAWFKMNSLPQHDVGNTTKSILKFFWLEMLGFLGAGVGVTLLLADWGEAFSKPPLNLVKLFVIVTIAVIVTLVLMKYLSLKEIKGSLEKQFEIFSEKHNWVMTYLYIMTFGSFIGFSAAFPKLILDSFGYLPGGATNPNAPDPAAFAWLGPLVGSLVRPIGGWMSDKWGGARVTHWDTIVMILSTLGVGYILILAKNSDTPEVYFPIFLTLFLILFITTGIGNGSTFRMVPIIFEKEKAGPVLGWISAIAAYGAFIIPSIFGIATKQGVPHFAMFGFAIYYITCLALNWWYYARKNAEMPC